MLQSYHRGNLTLDGLSNSFRLDVEQRAGRPLNIEQIAVGRGASAGPSEQRILDYIRSIYAGQAPPDLIVAIAGPASVFARKYRQQLFPDVPLVFAGADVRFLGEPLSARTRRRSPRSTITPAWWMTSCRCCLRRGKCSW